MKGDEKKQEKLKKKTEKLLSANLGELVGIDKLTYKGYKEVITRV